MKLMNYDLSAQFFNLKMLKLVYTFYSIEITNIPLKIISTKND